MGLCVNHHLLKIEASLMRVERVTAILVYGYKCQLSIVHLAIHMLVTACQRLVQAETTLDPSMEREGGPTAT